MWVGNTGMIGNPQLLKLASNGGNSGIGKGVKRGRQCAWRRRMAAANRSAITCNFLQPPAIVCNLLHPSASGGGVA